MGVVHLARRPGGERVALKVLRPHIVGDDEARHRLAREVNSLSRIKSRRVAEIVDADPWGDIPFVATRYVPGLSLHDHVHEEGPLAGADLVWAASCLAEALAAVHEVGVLRRDEVGVEAVAGLAEDARELLARLLLRPRRSRMRPCQ